METTTVDKFIGSAKILSSETDAQAMIHYALDNGLSQLATVEQFSAIISDTPYDDSLISMRKWKPTISNIINLMMENNAEFQDVGWILDRVGETVSEHANTATAKALGISSREKITLKQIDEILKTK